MWTLCFPTWGQSGGLGNKLRTVPSTAQVRWTRLLTVPTTSSIVTRDRVYAHRLIQQRLDHHTGECWFAVNHEQVGELGFSSQQQAIVILEDIPPYWTKHNLPSPGGIRTSWCQRPCGTITQEFELEQTSSSSPEPWHLRTWFICDLLINHFTPVPVIRPFKLYNNHRILWPFNSVSRVIAVHTYIHTVVYSIALPVYRNHTVENPYGCCVIAQSAYIVSWCVICDSAAVSVHLYIH